MNKRQLLITASVLLLLCQISQTVQCQNRFIKTPIEIKKLKKAVVAVETNPDNQKAHDSYIETMDIKDPALVSQYEIWIKRFPMSAIVPFAIGKAFAERDDPRGKKYLLDAVNINPKLAEAWELLSDNESLIGNMALASEDMQHASQSDPKNADYAFENALLFKDGDPAKYDSLMLNVAYHFPDSDRGAEALCYLADLPFNANEKNAYYETLYKMFSKQQTPWFKAGMRDYYNYLLNTSPEKAFDLALRMVLEIKINRGYWKQKLIVAREFVEAGKLLDENKPAEAAAILNQIDLGNSKNNGIMIDAEETLILFKARASYAGNKIRQAYDSLAVYYSKSPSDKVHQTLLNYAEKLGIDSNKVDTDIWKIRNDAAWKETDFTLQNFADHKQVSLSDYRGKVVLLTYWFPNCGPCRKEFPYFEATIKKFNNKNIAYLAINILNQEDDYVIPLVKNSGYSFVALRDDPNKAKGNLPNVQSVPENFLIDQRGRVIFSDFQIDYKNERTLELMIKELLKMGDTEKGSL
jgi:thiol-disulfide isomerase/thioredoxin